MAEKHKVINDNDLVPVKVRGKAYKYLKTISSWRGRAMSDYLSDLIVLHTKDDMALLVQEIRTDIQGKK